MTPRSSIERLADDAPVSRPGWAERRPTSAVYEATCKALEARAPRTLQMMTKAIAGRYAHAPRNLDAIGPGLSALSAYDLVPALARRMKAARQARPPRWAGFGSEAPLINLRGAALYARYERRKAWRKRRRI